MLFNRDVMRRQIVPAIHLMYSFEGIRRSDGRPISEEELAWMLGELFPEEYKTDPVIAERIARASRAKKRLQPTD
jgi:hypothetical protein